MSICLGCPASLTGWEEDGCESPVRDGAVGKLVFLHCSVDPTFGTPTGSQSNMLDDATLQALSDACKVRITPCVDGAKTADEDQYLFAGVCAGDKYVKTRFTITFTSVNTESAAFAFWNNLKRNSAKYSVGFFDGGGRFWGFFKIKRLAATAVLENATSDSTPPAKFTGVITCEPDIVDAPILSEDLIMSGGDTFEEFLTANINNDTGCGGGGAPLPQNPAFYPEIESIDLEGGDTFTDTQANLVSSVATVVLSTLKSGGCASNIVATAGSWQREGYGVVLASEISFTAGNPATFNQGAGLTQTQNMTITYGAGLQVGTYKVNINFVMSGGGACTQSTTKTITIIVT